MFKKLIWSKIFVHQKGEKTAIKRKTFLLGTVPRDFQLSVFFINLFPPIPRASHLRSFRIFENSQRYSHLKVHQRMVSLRPVANGKNLQAKSFSIFFYTFSPVSLIPVVHLDLRIFEQIRNSPNAIFRGLGEDVSWKKAEAKNFVTLSLFRKSVLRNRGRREGGGLG